MSESTAAGTALGVAVDEDVSPLAAFLPAAPPEEPYRGISPFRFADAAILPARADEVRQFMRLARVYRGVLLYGQSGVGKSSIINAGIIPDALREGFLPERLRVRAEPGAEILVQRIARDGSAALLPSHLAAGMPQTPPEVPVSLDHFVKRACEQSEHGRLLLIFDQFEEIVTQFEEAPRGEQVRQALDIQSRIFDAIVTLLEDHTIAVKVVLSFREDYLARFSALFRRCPDLPDHYLRLTPPTLQQIPTVVSFPLRHFAGQAAAKFGARPDDRGAIIPESVLGGKLAAALQARFAGKQVVPSEIQIVCRKLWHDDAPMALLERPADPGQGKRPGGVEGILYDYFSDAVTGFPVQHRGAIGLLLSQMVNADGARVFVERGTLIGLAKQATEIGDEALEGLLDGLVDPATKLVITERREEVTYHSIASEFLVPWIREQQRERQAALRVAAEKREAEAKLAREREEAARQRERAEQEEARRRHEADRWKKRAWVSVALVLAAFTFGLIQKNQQLTREKREADRATQSFLAAARTRDKAVDSIRTLMDSIQALATYRADSIALARDSIAATISRVRAVQRLNDTTVAGLRRETAVLRALTSELQRGRARDSAKVELLNASLRETQQELGRTRDQLNAARALVLRHVTAIRGALRDSDGDVREWAEKLCQRDSALCSQSQAQQAAPTQSRTP